MRQNETRERLEKEKEQVKGKSASHHHHHHHHHHSHIEDDQDEMKYELGTQTKSWVSRSSQEGTSSDSNHDMDRDDQEINNEAGKEAGKRKNPGDEVDENIVLRPLLVRKYSPEPLEEKQPAHSGSNFKKFKKNRNAELAQKRAIKRHVGFEVMQHADMAAHHDDFLMEEEKREQDQTELDDMFYGEEAAGKRGTRSVVRVPLASKKKRI
eukprot:TRINITY_DN5460_c0_g3_i1.p1 TRINITY_DN5460_c0_g3~~TRINITY_DN5460_c0_g3_i1.p1  ORF type:complete len:220 (+),score=35.52 TRINITY_DN5460_c0_g3_i1:33-662(+)